MIHTARHCIHQFEYIVKYIRDIYQLSKLLKNIKLRHIRLIRGLKNQIVNIRLDTFKFGFSFSIEEVSGGAKQDRTADLLRARQALSQLSYSPILGHMLVKNLVGLGRLELPTSPLSGVRSNQLSYRPFRGFTEASEAYMLGLLLTFVINAMCVNTQHEAFYFKIRR